MSGGAKSAATRERVATALAGGESVAEAAAGAGVSERQVFRWLAGDEAFNQLVADIHAEMFDEQFALLVEANRRAARRLLNLLGSEDPKIALKATAIALAYRGQLTQQLFVRRQKPDLAGDEADGVLRRQHAEEETNGQCAD
jgi:hypothetical protein